MVANLVPADAALHHQDSAAFGIAAIIVEKGMDPHIGTGPLRIERGGDRGLAGLVAATVTQKDDIAEAMLFQTAGGILQNLPVNGVGKTDGAGETHMAGGRIDAPSGT